MVTEGLNHSKANLVVYLHPSKAKSISEAILGELSSLLFTYNQSLDGVVLAFDPKISSNVAYIIPGITPNIGVHLRAELLMFSPKPNMVVEGEVVRITQHAINAVVLGFSSASIACEDVRGDFRFKSRKGAYFSRLNRKHKIGVGTNLRFRVKSFDGETLHVSGSLVDEDTGCAKWLDINVDVWNQVESTGAKKIVKVDKKEEGGLVEDGEMMSVKDDKKLKKSKRARVKEEVDVKVEEDVNGVENQKSEKVKVEVEDDNKEGLGLEAKEEMQLKDGVKSKKSKKARVREEKDNKDDIGLVVNEDMAPVKEEDEKPKKSKKRRKEQS